jgi:hypothetical protein
MSKSYTSSPPPLLHHIDMITIIIIPFFVSLKVMNLHWERKQGTRKRRKLLLHELKHIYFVLYKTGLTFRGTNFM